MPGVLAVAPPWRLPLLVPTKSFALPSAGHQPTSPEGGAEQFAADDCQANDRTIKIRVVTGEAKNLNFGRPLIRIADICPRTLLLVCGIQRLAVTEPEWAQAR